MKFFVTLAIALICFSQPALAHPGHLATQHGLMAGFLHPLTGVDHLAALLLSGVLLAQLPLRARLVSALSVFIGLLAGTALGFAFGGSTLLELLLLTSSMVLAGVLIRHSFSAFSATAMCYLLGSVMLLHGWAHGAELPAGQAGTFIIGFMFASLVLLSSGAILAMAFSHCKTVMVRMARG